MGNLTALQVKNAKQGRYSDGGGLILIVKESGAKSWCLRMQADGRRRDFGLGSASVVSLSEARERAMETRKLVLSGLDPVAVKRASRALKSPLPTFAEAAELVFEERKGSWRNEKHQAQWLSTLRTYVFPKIGPLPVDEVTGPAVRDLLAPIWQDKPETARRVLQRVTAVLDWAHAKGHRPFEAPIRAIKIGLAKQGKAVKHHAFLPYPEIAGLMRDLAEHQTMGRLALRFLILTAARSGEVRGATWDEIDLTQGLWTLPASRMKAKREHVVPLSAAAIEILRAAEKQRKGLPDEPVFPGNADKPLSDMTLAKVLRTARPGAWTVHGFRSSFRVWAAECVDNSNEIAEEALAHTIPNKVEAAYRRTNLLDRRRSLMNDWAEFVTVAAAAEG